MPSCSLFQVASIPVCVQWAFIIHSRSSVMKQYLDNKTYLKAQNHHSKSRLTQLLISILPTNKLAVMRYFLSMNCACLVQRIPRELSWARNSSIHMSSSYSSDKSGLLEISQRYRTATLSSSSHSERIQLKTTRRPQELSWVAIILLGASWLHRRPLRT